MYKLVRGTLMDAEICSVSFSADGLWIAVATSHGTAHVFAISPNGGHVDAVTHGIAGIAARPVEAPLEEADVPSLSAVARVKRSWIPSNVVSQGLPETQQATFYTIRCFTMGGGHWDVHKRYSELNALKTLLEAHPQTAEALAAIEKNAPFPAKTWGLGSWGKLDEGTIGERKEGLQLWLGNVLQHCPNEPSVLEFLRPAQVRPRRHSPCRVAGACPTALPGYFEQPKLTDVAFVPQAGDEASQQHPGAPQLEQWPTRVQFTKAENKSDRPLLPMCAAFLSAGGGVLPSGRMSRDSFLVFSAGKLSLHHLMLDLAVSLSDAGSFATTGPPPS